MKFKSALVATALLGLASIQAQAGPAVNGVESAASQQFAPRIQSQDDAPMSQQISKSLNNDGDEAVRKAPGKAAMQKSDSSIYNRNDDDSVPATGPRGTFTGPHHTAVKGTATTGGGYND